MSQISSSIITRVVPSPFRKSISRKIFVVLIPVIVLPVLIVGLVGYLRAQDLIASQVSVILTGIGDRQSELIQDWVSRRGPKLSQAVQRPKLSAAFEGALQARDGDQLVSPQDRMTIEEEFQTLNQAEVLFNHLLLVSPTGDVVVSTQQGWCLHCAGCNS